MSQLLKKHIRARRRACVIVKNEFLLGSFPYTHDIRDDRHALNELRIKGLLPAYQAAHELVEDKFLPNTF